MSRTQPDPLRRGRPLRATNVDATHVLLPGLGAARVAAGMSQRELAEAVRVSQPSVRNWESQLRRAPLDIVPRLAKALGCAQARLRRP